LIKYKVLVVDDSIVMRRIISDLLMEDAEIDVVGTARNGAEAIEKVRTLNPDVVTMDIEMPVMDGLTALQHIMAEFPRPVVMLSSMDKRQADITFKALELGAVDFIPKTSGSLSLDLERVSCTILDTVKAAAKSKLNVNRTPVRSITPTALPTLSGEWIVLIGCSTGGPKALPEVLSRLPGNLPALSFEGKRLTRTGWNGKLYDRAHFETESVKLMAVPYGLWGNRDPGEMLVWQKAMFAKK
jgi:two-component system chemotaxis response regulator CheB